MREVPPTIPDVVAENLRLRAQNGQLARTLVNVTLRLRYVLQVLNQKQCRKLRVRDMLMRTVQVINSQNKKPDGTVEHAPSGTKLKMPSDETYALCKAFSQAIGIVRAEAGFDSEYTGFQKPPAKLD